MEKTRIVITHGDKEPVIIECDGVALATLSRDEENGKYNSNVAVVGTMCTDDLIHMHDNIQKHLIPEIRKQAVSCAVESIFGE